jgi:pimeloyl-ACP methyl ester carboxylesterase
VTRFGYADTPLGQLHYAECGDGPAVVLLHQSPRSWDEYREVLPLLARAGLRAIAPDTIGFGNSARAPEHTIETYAAATLDFLTALGLQRAHLAGHHTGGVIALEVAARAPGRVDHLVLSSTPFIDAAARARRSGRPVVDQVTERPDGTHLAELWQSRQQFYPAGRPDLLARFVRDWLAAWPEADCGHGAVGAYRMEERTGLIAAPTLCIGASGDPYSFPDLPRLAAHIRGARTVAIEGGMVPLEFQAEQFANAVAGFVRGPGNCGQEQN